MGIYLCPFCRYYRYKRKYKIECCYKKQQPRKTECDEFKSNINRRRWYYG